MTQAKTIRLLTVTCDRLIPVSLTDCVLLRNVCSLQALANWDPLGEDVQNLVFLD